MNLKQLRFLLFILTLLGGAYYIRMVGSGTPQAKAIQFENAFRGVKLPRDAQSSAYSGKGKDLFAWGRVEMDQAALKEFVAENGLTEKTDP